jgi:hypothetical protein
MSLLDARRLSGGSRPGRRGAGGEVELLETSNACLMGMLYSFLCIPLAVKFVLFFQYRNILDLIKQTF